MPTEFDRRCVLFQGRKKDSEDDGEPPRGSTAVIVIAVFCLVVAPVLYALYRFVMAEMGRR